MTAITPNYAPPRQQAQTPLMMLTLLALMLAAVTAQAAFLAKTIDLSDSSQLIRITGIALYVAMVAGIPMLGVWAAMAMPSSPGRGARALAAVVRWSLYVAVASFLATGSLESRYVRSGGLAALLWIMRGLIVIGLPILVMLYISWSDSMRSAFGQGYTGQVSDAQMQAVSRDAAIFVLIMLAALVVVLVKASVPVFKTQGWSFLTGQEWRPNELMGQVLLDADDNVIMDEDTGLPKYGPDSPPVFGALPVIWGTAVSSLIALLVAVPLSFGAALFLVRVAPDLRPPVFLSFLFGASLTALLILMAKGSLFWGLLGLIGGGAATILMVALVARLVIPFVTPTDITLAVQGIAVAGFAVCVVFLAQRLIGLSWLSSAITAVLAGGAAWLLAPQLTAGISFLIEFLAAIPSIAYGIWGIFVLAPFLQNPVEPAFKSAWEALPYATWGHVFFFLGAPLICLIAAALIYRFASAVLSRAAVFTIWAFLFAAAVGCIIYGVRCAYHDVPVLTLMDVKIQQWTGLRPTLRWMFMYEAEIVGKKELREVAPIGSDMLCGGLILAIMIIPIITAISRDVLRTVPGAQVEGTTALGATWWDSSKEMLKYSRSALFGAVMLGLARAAGETMAVTMVIGNNPQIQVSPFMQAATMSSLLAAQFAEAKDQHRSALFGVALVLLVMSLLFNIVARYLVVGKGARTSAAH